MRLDRTTSSFKLIRCGCAIAKFYQKMRYRCCPHCNIWLGRLIVAISRHTILLIQVNDKVYAVDNRCPHMGFPLQRGTVKDCILTCDWHYARFDIISGGTFDPWAIANVR